MDALLRLVSLGSAARNTVKIKVRQPLAELKVQPGSDADRRARRALRRPDPRGAERQEGDAARSRHGPLLTLRGEAEPEERRAEVRRRGSRPFRRPLAKLPTPAPLRRRCRPAQPVELPLPTARCTLEPTDFIVMPKSARGLGRPRRPRHAGPARRPHHAGAGPRRHGPRGGPPRAERPQGRRPGDGGPHRAVPAHGRRRSCGGDRRAPAYIAAETLTVQWSATPLGAGAYRSEVKVDGQALTIQLVKGQRASGEAENPSQNLTSPQGAECRCHGLVIA